MYFNPPPQTSPAINKLAGSHHDPWGRPHQHHVLSSAAANGHGHAHAHAHGHGHGVVGPPTPGYSMYTNGASPGMQHHPAAHAHGLPTHPSLSHQHAAHGTHAHHHHHHQNSLSHPAFSSPPNGHVSQSALVQTSPPGVLGPVMTQHWQQQLLKYDVSMRNLPPLTCLITSLLCATDRPRPAIPMASSSTKYDYSRQACDQKCNYHHRS